MLNNIKQDEEKKVDIVTSEFEVYKKWGISATTLGCSIEPVGETKITSEDKNNIQKKCK
jgi:hypothetical protein